MDGLVAQRYALSLFEVSVEEGNLEDICSEVKSLGTIFEDNKDLFEILSTPVVTKIEKDQLITNIFGDKLSQYSLNFIRLLTEKGRISDYPLMVKEFVKLYNQKNNIKEVEAVTAIPLSKELFTRLKTKLEEITGKTVVMSNTVDSSIMGGVVLKMDDEQTDASVVSRLAKLRAQLQAVNA